MKTKMAPLAAAAAKRKRASGSGLTWLVRARVGTRGLCLTCVRRDETSRDATQG